MWNDQSIQELYRNEVVRMLRHMLYQCGMVSQDPRRSCHRMDIKICYQYVCGRSETISRTFDSAQLRTPAYSGHSSAHLVREALAHACPLHWKHIACNCFTKPVQTLTWFAENVSGNPAKSMVIACRDLLVTGIWLTRKTDHCARECDQDIKAHPISAILVHFFPSACCGRVYKYATYFLGEPGGGKKSKCSQRNTVDMASAERTTPGGQRLP